MPSHSNALDLESAWSIVFDGYDPEDEGRREALCAIGNGYFVTRAAAPEATADDIHYPGTYRAGLYNRLVSHIEGEDVDAVAANLVFFLPDAEVINITLRFNTDSFLRQTSR